jgi:hypothetical protein
LNGTLDEQLDSLLLRHDMAPPNPFFNYRLVPRLRQVSQRFRILTNMLPFWLDDDFEFTYLFPRATYTCSQALLNDAHLVETLSSKESWLFYDYSSLYLVDCKIPTFYKTVTTLVLGLQPMGSIFSISNDIGPDDLLIFRDFSNLRSLTLRGISDLDISVIAEVSPNLETFRVSGRMRGSLLGFSKPKGAVSV